MFGVTAVIGAEGRDEEMQLKGVISAESDINFFLSTSRNPLLFYGTSSSNPGGGHWYELLQDD
jgi:hypothetical protein